MTKHNGMVESHSKPISTYGLFIRALRLVAGTTLMEMATALHTTPARLSSIEFKRIEPSGEDLNDARDFFASKGVDISLEVFIKAAYGD